MHWSADFVGIPFEWGGYTRAGCSCWGLLRLVQAEVFNRHLPRHDEAVKDVAGGSALDTGVWGSGVKAQAIDLDAAQDGDVLRMWGVVAGKRAPLHVGLFVGSDAVLHIEEGTDSVIEKINAPRFRWRPIKAYRLG